MIKKAAVTILWVILNILLYLAMMAVDKNGGPHLVFIGLRILLVTSFIMMALAAVGIVKMERVK